MTGLGSLDSKLYATGCGADRFTTPSMLLEVIVFFFIVLGAYVSVSTPINSCHFNANFA